MKGVLYVDHPEGGVHCFGPVEETEAKEWCHRFKHSFIGDLEGPNSRDPRARYHKFTSAKLPDAKMLRKRFFKKRQ
jgi:hypothetical protein